MLPKQVIYIIEEYKFETTLVFALSVITLMFILISLARENLNSGNLGAATVYSAPNYPIINKQEIPQTLSAYSSQPWPMRGLVTTEFGVPHRPWQALHSGIDISSRARSGVSSVTVFREGTVIATTKTYNSYGNHVLVDHGGGLTSLYGHLATITATEGQRVRPGDTIGHEGSTGASTGTHLHFEIREHGIPVSPRKYFSDSP